MINEFQTSEQLLFFDADDYQEAASKFAKYPEAGTGSMEELSYLFGLLCEEAGEAMGKLNKRRRDGTWDPEAVAKELGDVAWAWANACKACGFDPSYILTKNISKLTERFIKGTIQGSGDNR